MRTPSFFAAFLAAALLTPFASAQQPSAKKDDLRSNDPIVKAVQKTRNGVVAIRVPRPGEKDMIGSGLIFDEGGLIVTNYHVTGGKAFVKVRLHDDTDLTGEVVAKDINLDLAVIKVESKQKLEPLTFGPVDLMVGEPVLARGNPYGYEGTVSRGIISALNRKIQMPNDYMMTGLIQHDAPINPGNSGGPLININGEVIGINVAMRDGAQNIAFAINASTVKGFVNQYLQKVASAGLGLKVEEKVIAETGDRQRVVVKFAADTALKSGDVILAVGTLKIANTVDVERAIWQKRPGQQVPLTVVRQGREMSVTLTLTEASHGAGQTAATAAASNVRSVNER